MSTPHVARFWTDGDRWFAEVTDLPAVRTYGRTFAEVHGRIREQLIDWLGSVGDDEISDRSTPEVRDLIDLDDATRRVADLIEERRQLERWQADLQRRIVEAIHVLRARGMSMRDIAKTLELSHQRVHQLSATGGSVSSGSAEISVTRQLAARGGSTSTSSLHMTVGLAGAANARKGAKPKRSTSQSPIDGSEAVRKKRAIKRAREVPKETS